MNRSSTYSPLQVSRRWKSPTLRASTSSFSPSSVAVKSTGKLRSLWSRISSPPKTSSTTRYHSGEAETPFIFWTDEKYPIKEKKRERFVDPFEAKPAEKSKPMPSSPVSFEIVGTIRCIVPVLETIVENEQLEEAGNDCLETKSWAAGMVSSPTSIKLVGSFDPSPSALNPVNLFPDDSAKMSDEFSKTASEDNFESVSFDGFKFEDDYLDSSGIETDITEDESVELWTDSAGMPNGFTKAKGFQSHDWDDETE